MPDATHTTVSVLTLRVPADRVSDVIAYYQREHILQASGASASQLLIDDHDPGTIVVLAWWPDPAGYAGWQNAPQRDAFTSRYQDADTFLMGFYVCVQRGPRVTRPWPHHWGP